MTVFLGIDPGLRGGWAVVSVKDGRDRPIRLEATGALPLSPCNRRIDAQAFARTLRGMVWSWPDTVGVVEAVNARPGQGLSSTWAFAHAAGTLEGVLAGLGVVEVRRIAPGAWKASYGLSGGKAGKAGSIELAKRLWRYADLGEHEAEAMLMAWREALKERGL
jgi:Holliday junction resolvasome RuvABC endonuclease subunit